jgi:hypothetical protein
MSDEAQVDEVIEDSPTDHDSIDIPIGIDPANPDSMTTPESEDYSNKKAQSLSKLVALTIKTLDPKSMTRRYAAMGAAFIKHCEFQKSSIKAWIASDYDTAIDRVTDAVRMESAITDVRMNTYVRVSVFVSCVKPLVPGVEDLSYQQIANKFLPTITFYKVELTGEIRKGWVTFLQRVVPIQLSDSPLSMADLDAQIESHKTELEAQRQKDAGKPGKPADPDKELKALQDKKEKEFKKAKNAALATITESIDGSIGESLVTPNEIMKILSSVATERTLAHVGRLKEIVELHKILGRLVATAQAQIETVAA